MVTEHSRLTDIASPLVETTERPSALIPRQIPWGYGRDRVTAVAVDPNTLFVYWELKDDTIEQARAQLGQAGADAALVLRVFDTSGRIFDGTNAHSSFDQDVHRNDRQWFCRVGKPASSAHIEMSLRTRDGRYLRIVRSGRVDFPRSSPAPGRLVEWMRVVPQTGQIEGREIPSPPWHDEHAGAPGAAPPGPAGQGGGAGGPGYAISEGHTEFVEHGPSFEFSSHESWEHYEREFVRFETDSGWQIDADDPNLSYRMVNMRWEEFGLSSSRWETGPVESSWQAGPFNYPTEVVGPSVEHYEGPRLVFRTGEQVRVLHGPWQVVIRGLNPRAEHRLLGRWEVHRTWLSATVRQVDPAARNNGGLPPGIGGPGGASERQMLSASELRLRGASEVFYLGASERRFGGASETRFMGASEYMLRGASERRIVGQSELRMAGQSELRMLGASERRLAGQSELRMLGASERRWAGASERHLGGASERRLGGASERRSSNEATFGTPVWSSTSGSSTSGSSTSGSSGPSSSGPGSSGPGSSGSQSNGSAMNGSAPARPSEPVVLLTPPRPRKS